MSTDNSNKTAQKSSSKAPIVIIAVIAIAAAAFFMLKGNNAYETFTLAMNKTFGEGKWSAEKHSVSLLGGSLTVEGFSVALPYEGSTLKADSIEVKTSLSATDIDSISSKKDWDGQSNLKLADKLLAKGVSITSNNKSKLTYSFEEIGGENLTLAAATENTPKGAAGYLKSLHGGSFHYKNMKSSIADTAQGVFEVNAGSVSAKNFSFDGKGFNNIFIDVDPSGIFDAALGLRVKEYAVKNLDIAANTGGEQKIKFSAGIDEQIIKDMDGLRKFSLLNLRGFKFNYDDGKGTTAVYKMDEVSGTNFDMDTYIDKLLPLIKSSLEGGHEEFQQALSGLQNFGDLFASPISFDRVIVKGVEFNLSDVVIVKLEEAVNTGPYKAGEVPISAISSIKGLEVKLSDKPHEQWPAIADFVRDFGMGTFVLNGESRSSYDHKTGTLAAEVNSFKVDDLFDLSFNIKIDGLSKERLDTLKATSMDNMLVLLLAPQDVFGDLALNELRYKVTDHGLLKHIYQAYAKTKISGLTPEAIRALHVKSFRQDAAQALAGYVENQEAVINTIGGFLEKGGSIELKIMPQPPLSVTSAMARQGDPTGLLNSLNISVAGNNEEGIVLKFTEQKNAGAELNDEEMKALMEEMEAEGK